MTEEQRVKEWHLDRKVTISLIVALLANAGATVWWASKLDTRVTHLEAQQIEGAAMPERMARVETKVEGIREDLKDINRKLDRLIDQR